MGEHPGNMFTRAGQMLRGIGLSRAVTVGATVGLTSSSASYCSTAAPTTQVRIAQYNILSDSLDAPDHYIHCDPNDLDHEIRFQRVAAKLEEQMRAGAVLCLCTDRFKVRRLHGPMPRMASQTVRSCRYLNHPRGRHGRRMAQMA